jgi:hypothetical protein
MIATMFAILQPMSNHSSAWLLRRQRDLIELSICHELKSHPSSRSLSTTEKSALDSIPSDTRTLIKRLKLDPLIFRLNCCSKCFATYPLDRTPNKCYHRDDNVDEAHESDTPDKAGNSEEEPSAVCGQPLFKLCRSVNTPVRYFAYQSLNRWIARLLTRPGIEDALDQSLTPSIIPSELVSSGRVSDIHGSRIWRQFEGPDGEIFTKQSGNLIFGLFIDAINPYGNKQAGKHASITFMVLVCMSLPYQLRFLPENLFLVGIAPGPKEPSLTQTNWILKPMVEQLNALWNTGLSLSCTHRHPQGRHIRAALVPFFADLPALRRALGFPGHASNKFMCSFCDVSKSNIKNLDRETWNARTSDHHIKWAHASRDADTAKERNKIFSQHGVRYSVLTELPYWKPNEYQTVDAMHNLLLGLFKWHCTRLWGMSDKAVNEDYTFGRSQIPQTELVELGQETADHAEEYLANRVDANSDLDEEPDEESESLGALPFFECEFGSITDSSDTNWDHYKHI